MPLPPLDVTQSQTALSVRTHSFSGRKLGDYPYLVEALLAVKLAAARANELPSGILERIEVACVELKKAPLQDWFAVDVWQGGGAVAVNMNVNEAIVSMDSGSAPLQLREEVNRSQSTADVCATAMRLALARGGASLLQTLTELQNSLASKATEFYQVPSMARTCLQDASPTTLGVLFEGYSEVFRRALIGVGEGVKEIRKVNLGGTVFGSGEGASESYRKRVLSSLQDVLYEWDWPHEGIFRRDNLFDAAQNMDDLSKFSQGLSEVAQASIKLAKDLRLLTSQPFSELKLPAVIKGSSFYEAKNNPTLPETTLLCAYKVLGQDQIVSACRQSGELHLNVFEFSAGIAISESVNWLDLSLNHLNEGCVAGLEALAREKNDG